MQTDNISGVYRQDKGEPFTMKETTVFQIEVFLIFQDVSNEHIRQRKFAHVAQMGSRDTSELSVQTKAAPQLHCRLWRSNVTKLEFCLYISANIFFSVLLLLIYITTIQSNLFPLGEKLSHTNLVKFRWVPGHMGFERLLDPIVGSRALQWSRSPSTNMKN